MLLLIPLYALMALVTSLFAPTETTVTEYERPTVLQIRRHHHRTFHRYPQTVYYQQSYYRPSYQQPTFHRSTYGAMYYGGAHPVIVRQQHFVYTR